MTPPVLALILCLILLSPIPAPAATEYTWTYPGDGNWSEPANWDGGGAISGPFTNLGTVRADAGTLTLQGEVSNPGLLGAQNGGVLNLNGNTLNTGKIIAQAATVVVNGPVTGHGRVEVRNDAALVVNNYLETGDFFMSQTASLVMANYTTLALLRNFAFQQTDESLWSWGYQSVLEMKGAGGVYQALEIGGQDLGLSDLGFVSNFNLVKLLISTPGAYAYLADFTNNGNRSSDEALYVDALEVLPGAILNLNKLHLYTWLNGAIHLVAAGEGNLFGGGQIIDSVVPIPSSLLLLGSALVGLLAASRRFGRK